MNLSKSNQIINLITTIREAITELTKSEKNVSLQILADCQDGIFAIHDLLQNSGNENSMLSQKLEELIKLIYDIYENLLKTDILQTSDVVVNKLSNKVEEINELISYRIQGKSYEIVFLPYKASMWDCFDSIYKEVVQDPKYNVVVLPVPYYTLDSNGNKIELVYEGNQLPEYVEITDYQEYDIKGNNPDAIFIHNPYDGFNKVTRMLEKYYSGELRKYTEYLVYIPYFVSDGNRGGDYLYSLPAIKNSWKTIVQSKEVRNAYLRYANPDKVVAIGSPKFDMVMSNNMSISMQESWKEKIEGKKVYLYNTNLSSILDESISLIDRIEKVIDVFRKNKESVLLWRPHPLNMETARTFHSMYFDKYISLVNEFRLMENGIYDDTSDIARAIILSDAYIGDEASSVVPVYKATQKPMLLISNNTMDEKIFLKHLSATAATIYKDEIWLFSDELCSIFTVSLSSGETKLFSFIQDKNNGRYPLFTDMIIHNEKLYLIPCCASRLCVIDLVNRKNHYIDINKERDNSYSVALKGDIIYLLPAYYSSEMICIDTATEKVQKYNYPLQTILPPEASENMPAFKGVYPIENRFWQALTIAPVIMNFNLELQNFNIYEVKSTNKSFFGITFDGEDFWLLPKYGETIVQWSPKLEQVVQEIAIPDWFQWKDMGTFIDLIYFEGAVWLVPYLADKIIKINAATGEVKGIDYRIKGFQLDYEGANPFLKYQVVDSKLYLYPDKSNMLIWIDMITEDLGGFELLFPTGWDTWDKLQLIHECAEKNVYSHQEIYRERICSVEDFITVVNANKTQMSGNDIVLNDTNDGNNGKRIWQYVKDNLEGVYNEMDE